MRKLVKIIWTLALAVSMFLTGLLISDKIYLRNELIRLRVVAASDSEKDQEVKLLVKDAVNTYLQEHLAGFQNADQVRTYLEENLTQIEAVANKTLAQSGQIMQAKVYMSREAAERRDYETFSLPSGVYETLRVDIGPADGKNWWCVVFPSLCMPQTVETFAETAESSGVRPGLTASLAGDRPFKVRFFLLDLIGKAENFFDFS